MVTCCHHNTPQHKILFMADHQLLFPRTQTPYGCTPPPTPLALALSMISDTQAHTRQQALQLLAPLAALQPHGAHPAAAVDIDAIFQRLCVVAATDPVPKLRCQALQTLSGCHHASTTIKLQALSKKATLRVLLPSTAAAPAQQQQQQPPAKKQRKQQQQPQAEAGLLDAATGAFVHGTEDDLPRVRMAAVAAVVSLAGRDALFADMACSLLADLVGDQLLEVRQAALAALLDQASAFQQHRHQQQQQAQQQRELSAQQRTAGAEAVGTDTDMTDAGAASQQEEEEEDGELCEASTGPADDLSIQAQATASNTAAAVAAQQQVRRKPRKTDLPPWGKDALLAAAAALSDADPSVRRLALQLLQLLPPGNVPDLLTVVRGAAACCERYAGRMRISHDDVGQVWALVAWLGRVRAEMVTLGAAKLVPQMAGMLLGGLAQAPAAAAGAHGDAAGADLGVPDDGRQQQAAAAAAAGAVGDAVAGLMRDLAPGVQVLAALLLLGVQQRRAGLPTLLKELQKAGLLDVQQLQPWLASIRALQQQQQQQQQEAAETGEVL